MVISMYGHVGVMLKIYMSNISYYMVDIHSKFDLHVELLFPRCDEVMKIGHTWRSSPWACRVPAAPQHSPWSTGSLCAPQDTIHIDYHYITVSCVQKRTINACAHSVTQVLPGEWKGQSHECGYVFITPVSHTGGSGVVLSRNGCFSFSFPDISLPHSHHIANIQFFNSEKWQNYHYCGYVFIAPVSHRWVIYWL